MSKLITRFKITYSLFLSKLTKCVYVLKHVSLHVPEHLMCTYHLDLWKGVLTTSDSFILMVILLTASVALEIILRNPAPLRAWVLTALGNFNTKIYTNDVSAGYSTDVVMYQEEACELSINQMSTHSKMCFMMIFRNDWMRKRDRLSYILP